MFLQGSTPNSDWGAARGAGKTNNPSLYNVKYRANRTSLSRSNSRTVSSTHAMLPWARNTNHKSKWWSQTGSNRRPPECKSGALPAELWPHFSEIAMTHPGRSQRQGPRRTFSPPRRRSSAGHRRGLSAVMPGAVRSVRQNDGGHGWTRTTDLTLIRRVL